MERQDTTCMEATNRLERRTLLVAMELTKYSIIDIAVLSETPFYASIFYWSGKPNGVRREAGVGFVIKRDIVAKLTEIPHPVSDRIMTMRIPLTKECYDSQCMCSNNGEPRREQGGLHPAKGDTPKHPQYR